MVLNGAQRQPGSAVFRHLVEPNQYKGEYAHRTLELIDAVKQQVARHPDELMLATSPEGIEEAHRAHKIAILMGIEGGHSIEDSLGLLRQYYALGARYMTLTWNNSTAGPTVRATSMTRMCRTPKRD